MDFVIINLLRVYCLFENDFFIFIRHNDQVFVNLPNFGVGKNLNKFPKNLIIVLAFFLIRITLEVPAVFLSRFMDPLDHKLNCPQVSG